MKTQDTKTKFIELRAKGFSYKRIAKQLHVSKQTLINWSYDFKTQIANLKEIEIDTLMEKYYMMKQSRLGLFGKQLLAIEKEIETRDLKDIPTYRLFNIFLKFMKAIKLESNDITFEGTVPLADSIFKNNIEKWEG